MQEYRSMPRVAWAVNTDGIVLTNEATGAVCRLGYPEAAVWDLISRGYSYEVTVSLLCTIGSLTLDSAERLVLESLAAWASGCFLTTEAKYG